MKAIKDLDKLIQRLSNNSVWQRTIYEATGVILSESLFLISNCGYVSLEHEFEYSFAFGNDTTEYCEINTVDEIILYIKEMGSYTECLLDMSCGRFNKSELFWAVYERILLQYDNLNASDGPYWSLSNITGASGYIELHMALVPSGPVDVFLSISDETTVNDVMEMLISEFASVINDDCWQPVHTVYDIEYSVPKTYDELKAKCIQNEVFNYMNVVVKQKAKGEQ